MTHYLSISLELFLSRPGAFVLAAVNLSVLLACACVLAYVVYVICGGTWDALAWVDARRPVPVSVLPARVWRAVGVAGLVVLFVLAEL